MAKQLTADTITDVEIRRLLARAERDGSRSVVRVCRIALDDGVTHRTAAQLREARGRCAMIINSLEGLEDNG